jgi:outer membrane protein
MRVRPALSAALVFILPLAARAEAGASAPRLDGVAEAGAASPAVERLRQDEVVRRALLQSGVLRGAQARRAGAEAEARSARGRLLPSVRVSDQAQRWNSPYGAEFPAGPGTSVPVTIREQTTNSFSATAGQPLLGLLHIGADVAALGSAERAAEADVRTSAAAVKEAALSQLLGLFEARALGEVARASVDQLAEQLQTARARLRAGVVTRADVLRIETAVAAARQQVIQAGAEEESARAALLVAIGEPPDARGIDFDEPVLPEPAAAPDLAPALATALSRRPELESARDAERAARRSALARTFELLPEVNAEAAYLHITGQVFSPRDSGFVGVTVSWPVWEWGARWYARSAAVAQAESAAAQEVDVRDRVSVQVAARLATTRASAHAIEVARTAIASAEEAYRVTKALVDAGSATTTDLLDAQAALTSAHSNLARARYAYALARVNLARALGEL